MKVVSTIFRKELAGYFSSPIAYIYMVTFLVFIGWFFFRGFFLVGQASMRSFFELVPWVFLFFIPAISMRAWSEEKKAGTLDFLLTFPVRDWEVILGKFLASIFLLVLTLLGTIPLALIVMLLGNPDLGAIFSGYLGLVLLGAAFMSIGFLMSSLTQNQIVAFILSVVVCFFSYILSQGVMLYSLPSWMAPVLSVLSVGAHFDSVSKGVIDLSDFIYYGSFIGFFLFLNGQVLDWRRVR